ncbi:MAG: hypothetical protein AAGG81_03585 [Chlamydiota bacterium]
MYRKYILMAFILSPILGWANMGPQGFHQFNVNKIFVETGTFCGDSVQKALDAGFKHVYSLEINPKEHMISRKRFARQRNVHLFLKDSSYQLWDVISSIHEPITFWLDAHNGFPDPNAVGVSNTALMGELEQIKRHPIKNHIILIDDLHCCDTLLFDYLSLQDIVDKIMEINPEYNITFVDGGNDGEYADNILVAYIEENE